MKTWIIAAAAALAVPLAAGAQEPPPAAEKPATVDELFYRAFYEENGLRDFAKAAGLYAKAADASEAAGNKDLLVRSLLGRARCLATTGKADDAKAAFGRVLAADPENEEAKNALAGGSPAGSPDLLEAKIEEWVGSLWGSSEARQRAVENLGSVGDLAVPHLGRAVRAVEIDVSRSATRLLATINTPASLAALERAFGDPSVPYPGALVESLRALMPGPGALRVFQRAIAATSGKSRAEAIGVLVQRLPVNGWSNQVDPVPFGALLRTALTDPAPEVRFQAVGILRLYNPLPGTLLDEVRPETLGALLRDPDVGVATQAVSVVPSCVGTAWSDSLSEAVLDAVGRVLDGSLKVQNSWQVFQLVSDPARRRFPEDRLETLFSKATAPGQTSGPRNAESLQAYVVNYLHAAADKDDARRRTVVAEGWKRMDNPAAKAAWLNGWAGKGGVPPQVAAAAAADPAGMVRTIAYAWIRGPTIPEEKVAEALPFLAQDLVSEDAATRKAAFAVAARFKVPALVPALREFHAKAAPGEEKDAALRALVNSLGREALPEIREDLASNQWATARDLLVGVLKVEAVPELAALALRLKRSQEVGANMPPEVFEAYLDALPREMVEPWWGYALQYVSPDRRRRMVLEGLQMENNAAQTYSIEAARQSRIVEAWPHLLRLLDSPNSGIRQPAQVALTEIRAFMELKGAFERYGQGDPAKAAEKARALLASEDTAKRKGAVFALGALGDPAAIQDLLGLLDDRDAGVREAALAALERLGGKPR